MDQPLIEYMKLEDGRVVPARTSIALQRGESNDARWAPPVFDVDGVRIAVVFDFPRTRDVADRRRPHCLFPVQRI